MRTLLEKDYAILSKLQRKIYDGVSRKKPNSKSKQLRVDITILRTEVEHQILCYKLKGKNTSVLDIAKDYLNRNEVFVPISVEIKHDGDYFRIISVGKEPSESWMRLLKKLDRLVDLKNAGYSWLMSMYPQRDFRNYFEQNGELRYGLRKTNDYDARLLGEIESSIFVMSIEDYDKELMRIKRQKNKQ